MEKLEKLLKEAEGLMEATLRVKGQKYTYLFYMKKDQLGKLDKMKAVYGDVFYTRPNKVYPEETEVWMKVIPGLDYDKIIKRLTAM